MTTPTDDRELLMTLAQACGWKIQPDTHPTIKGIRYCLLNPQGEKMRIGESVEDTWICAFDYGEPLFPDWLRSVDAALSLPWPTETDTERYVLEIRISPGRGTVVGLDRYVKWIDEYGAPCEEQDLSWYAEVLVLARALCECFAQWWKEKEK